MLRFALAVLFAVSTVCALPGVSSAQNWYSEGPAARHDSGYVYPGTSSPGRSLYGVPSPTYYPAYQYYVVPGSNPVVARNPMSLATEEEQEVRANSASILVQVPANAEIWFDNSKTKSTGSLRTFVSPPLESGKTFTYVIHARWTDSSGKVIDQTKRVEVQAGQRSRADFTSPVEKNMP
jgi:uncharacterized protein (TIGR03000 family)